MTYEEALRLVYKCKYAEADEVIIKALEKQIPVKPLVIPLDTFKCPKCRNPWLRCGQEYCDRCGRKLDWIPEGYVGNAKAIEFKRRTEDRSDDE